MPRVLLDFTDGSARGIHLALENPREVITAGHPSEVLPALAAVQDGVRRGLTAAGFISYEASPAFEPRMRVHARGRMPLLWFGLFDREGELPAEADPSTPTVENAGDAQAAGPQPASTGQNAGGAREWRSLLGPADYEAAVRTIHERIASGHTYQVNLTTRLRAAFEGDPLALWHRMRRAQGPGFHAFLDLGPYVIASASPELFFATRGRSIITRPMKGTRPRGRWTAEDMALRAQLESSPKDRAENLMIVDLLRNDLGRIAVTGSVRTPRLLGIERYRTVWQLTSTIEATLRDDVDLPAMFSALFPCGSVTGAPKISTMEIIAELEPAPREVYCGAIGVVRPGGDATFSVPIRTAWIDRVRGEAEYGTGSGIVWDSTAGSELEELLAKAVVVRSPWPPFRLLETMRIEDGRAVRADRHLARLRDSAAYFGFPLDESAVESALRDALPGPPSGARRLRLLVDEHGGVESQVGALEGPVGSEAPHASAPQPVPVALAAIPISSDERFLYHKTTRRGIYDRALAAAPEGVWDVILVNERGELTELTRGNLVLARDGALQTPPLDAGLLPGCFRAELLEAGILTEATVRPADLETADGVWLINSLRGWIPLGL